ncbi:1-phosphofructokinase [Alicyclobacillus shizuokensis]|uniref:1-phosphofructokinase n=1 Tax=Alicyclobacillus shizuokensis TaxID=392014 RepID=UPI00083539E3|nr:1-phosphofructokinase [Alicyclobacillus shizuokensis]MCL6625554.1 1-phosphofructokinase [Alicyclobacillus shizuokensis]
MTEHPSFRFAQTSGIHPAAFMEAAPPFQAETTDGREQHKHPMDGESAVVTVTVNPAMDLFLQVDRLVPGTLHRVQQPRPYTGGKGINVTKALHTFGIPTVATGFLGGSRGAWIEQELRESGISASFVWTHAPTRVNVKVIEANGRLTEFNASAPAFSTADWRSLEDHLDELTTPGGWLALCGNLPESANPGWYQGRIEWARAKGLYTVLDASGEALRHGIAAAPDVIKPNLVELEEYVGDKLGSVREVVQAAARLCEQGIRLVAVSMGKSGLVAVTCSERIWAHVPKVPVVSSVGAGDTVVAGIVYGLHHQFSLADTVRFAAAAGTAAVQTAGSMRPVLQDVRAVVPQVELESLPQP